MWAIVSSTAAIVLAVHVVHADTGAYDRFHIFGGGDEFIVNIGGRARNGNISLGNNVQQCRLVDVCRENVINLRIILQHLQTSLVDMVTYDYFVFFHDSFLCIYQS